MKNKTTGWCDHKRLCNVWERMLARCENPATKEFKYYGARGITVCDEWHNMNAFVEWALQNGYKEDAKRGECTLDRIDVNGQYAPNNCRWISQAEQMQNTRANHLITFNGETKCLAEWERLTGVSVSRRLALGRNVEEAITKPKTVPSYIPVRMFSKRGEFIRDFYDRRELYDTFKTHTSRIFDCCEGKVQKAFGYHWEYIGGIV